MVVPDIDVKVPGLAAKGLLQLHGPGGWVNEDGLKALYALKQRHVGRTSEAAHESIDFITGSHTGCYRGGGVRLTFGILDHKLDLMSQEPTRAVRLLSSIANAAEN